MLLTNSETTVCCFFALVHQCHIMLGTKALNTRRLGPIELDLQVDESPTLERVEVRLVLGAQVLHA